MIRTGCVDIWCLIKIFIYLIFLVFLNCSILVLLLYACPPGQHGTDYCTYSGPHCPAAAQHPRTWAPGGPWVGAGSVAAGQPNVFHQQDRSLDRGDCSSFASPSVHLGHRCGGGREVGVVGVGGRGSEHVYETAATRRGTGGGAGECLTAYFDGTQGGTAVVLSGTT